MPKVVERDIQKIKKGIDVVADAVKVTIGPRGKNVVIESGLHPIIANDGGRIAKELVLKDPIENIGASIIKEVIQRTSEDVGGGRTASAIITQAVTDAGLKLTEKGFNQNLLKKGMNLAVTDICTQLDKMAQPVKKGDIEKVAAISTESEELGKVIADTMEKVGVEGIVTVEESQTFGITSHIEEGLKCNQGYISPFMTTNERLEAEYTDIPVLITEKKITLFKEIQPLLDELVKKGKKELMIIAEDFGGEALNVAVLAKLRGQFNLLAIKTPGIGDLKKLTQEDLCALVGATLDTEHVDGKLGTAKKVLSRKDSTIILGKGNVKEWVEMLKKRRSLTENKWEIDQYNERIAKLQNGIAVIKVGAASETEVKYLKLKIEDGVNEAKRAMEEGIVVGGNCAYLNALKSTKSYFKEETPQEIEMGYHIVTEAVQAPLRQIVQNGNGRPDVIVENILTNPSLTAGYDSLAEETVNDMFERGIVDAVKVSKTVLQNAVSAASMFLSTELAIAEEPKEN